MNKQPPHDAATQQALERLSLGMRAIAERILQNEENERRAKEEQERVCTACGRVFRPVATLGTLCAICVGRARPQAAARRRGGERSPPQGVPKEKGGAL